MIIISQSLALSPGFLPSANNPVIGWRNLLTVANITAETASMDHPASNLANPSTHLRWEGVAASPAVAEFGGRVALAGISPKLRFA